MISQHKPRGLARLVDSDIAEAASALAATIEIAGRGVIYDHAPQAPPAQALMADMKALLAQVREQGATVYDGETAIVLRAIEQGAGPDRAHADGDTAYKDLIARLLQLTPAPQTPAGAPPPGPLILP